MASLRQIRRRMKSIENIHEITKAMEMIAAFRFKRSENRFTKSKPYLLEMERLVAKLSGAAADIQDPLFEKREIRKKALVVMTGDKGLCGAYNANLIRAANQWLNENAGVEKFLVPVGKVGTESFRKKQIRLLSFYPEKSAADSALAKKITDNLKQSFLEKKVDSVEILYTTFRSGAAGQNKVIPFLGLAYLLNEGKSQTAQTAVIYEPDFKAVFLSLLSRTLEGKILLCLLESLTSEYSARMIAMKQATENGEEVLDGLKLLRNKTRQATITRELSEIVSGASVLI